MSFQEMAPEQYQELMLECVRALPFTDDKALVAFRVWDEENAASDQSFLFLVDGFENGQRVWAGETDVRDVWAQGDSVVLLTATELIRFEGGRFDAPTIVAHEVAGAASLAGRSARDLYVVGHEVAHFDGAKWNKLAYSTGDDSSLVDVAVVGDKVFAVGDGGELIVIEGGQVRSVKAPGEEPRFAALAVDADETLYVAGTLCLRGTIDALTPVPMPEESALALGVGRFGGTTYWGFVGDEPGLGLFAEEGDELVPVAGEVACRMASNDRFLYAAGESLVFRVDGDDVVAMAMDYDDESESWVLVVAEPDEGEDDGDEEEGEQEPSGDA